MRAKEMWEKFLRSSHADAGDYEAWAFGGAPDELAELVLTGQKTATSSAYELYELEKEPLPQIGAYSVILDSKGEARCVIRTTKLAVIPFRDVSPEHAAKEGEGDKSLQYWRAVHKDFFTECLQKAGLPFRETMPVLCEEFEVCFQ